MCCRRTKLYLLATLSWKPSLENYIFIFLLSLSCKEIDVKETAISHIKAYFFPFIEKLYVSK